MLERGFGQLGLEAVIVALPIAAGPNGLCPGSASGPTVKCIMPALHSANTGWLDRPGQNVTADQLRAARCEANGRNGIWFPATAPLGNKSAPSSENVDDSVA